jgi:hypothetical protein
VTLLWAHFGITLGSVLDYGITFEYLWANFGISLGSLWDSFKYLGTILGSIRAPRSHRPDDPDWLWLWPWPIRDAIP